MCNQCLLDPKMDFIFKRIFGNENEPEILIRFLNALLEPKDKQIEYDPIVTIEIKNGEIPKASIEDKYSVLDVRAKTGKGEIIHIEIQRKDEHDMLKRSIYYLNQIFTEQIESGENYEKLNRVVSIIIMNYHSNFIPNEDFHNVYRFKNIRTEEELTDLQELHYIELPKMTHCDEEDVLQLFLEFLKNPNSHVVESKVGEIKELSKAKQKLALLSRDPKMRDEFNAREKALKDKNSALATAEAKGIAKGIEQGIERGEYKAKIESAKNLLDVLEDEIIAKKIELPLVEVNKLRKEYVKNSH
ncbi:MAG: Rpn family recombination-promoting nuclease/putative transposase [Eubacteriales bacterium]